MMHPLRRALGMLASSQALFFGVLTAAVVAGGAFLFIGGPEHTVVARFADADGLVSGNEIRVAGIEAGTVKSVVMGVDRNTGQQFAEAVLSIDDSHWPLHQGTKLAVRPKGVLSNVYVALEPGGRTAATIDTHHIFGVQETSSPVNLDEFSNIFNADVRTSLRTQIQEGVIAFGGSGAENTNAVLHNLNPLSADLDPVTKVLAVRSPELSRLNTEFDTITHQLAAEDANLRGLLRNSNVFFGALAAKQRELQSVLDHAGSTLASIDSGLKGEEDNLKAFFAKGPQALDKTKRASDLLLPLITDVNPHIPHLEDLLHYFMTATGYQVPNHGSGQGDIATTRVDAILPPPDKKSQPCGGAANEQKGCPYRATASTAPEGGSAATAGYQRSTSPFGGLFG
jgi:ABC-type transporter Mla subunit MlaD